MVGTQAHRPLPAASQGVQQKWSHMQVSEEGSMCIRNILGLHMYVRSCRIYFSVPGLFNSAISSRSLHTVEDDRLSHIFRLYSIHLGIYITFALSNHLFINTYFDHTAWLLCAQRNIGCTDISDILISVPWFLTTDHFSSDHWGHLECEQADRSFSISPFFKSAFPTTINKSFTKLGEW